VKNGLEGLNRNFYLFDFEKFQFTSATAEELNQPIPTTTLPTPKPPTTTPQTPKPPTFTPPTPKPSEGPQPTPVVVGLSIGIGLIGLSAVGAFIFVLYRRKKNLRPDDPRASSQMSFNQRSTLYENQQYPPSPHSSQYQFTNKQFMPQQRFSDFNNLTQPQGYSGQEHSILPIPPDGDRYSNYSSNYNAGSGTYPYSPGSETPPPPPPKTP
jgi:hypothetical protein